MDKIRVAILGVGNCASSLVQGRYHYAGEDRSATGLMHDRIGGYGPADMEFVLAFDTDARKVGLDLAEAVFAEPNCTTVFHADVPATGVEVRMGRVLDGMADHMLDVPSGRGFVRADLPEAERGEIVAALRETRAEVLVNFLPVGSEAFSRGTGAPRRDRWR